jgi:hypothetical protein
LIFVAAIRLERLAQTGHAPELDRQRAATQACQEHERAAAPRKQVADGKCRLAPQLRVQPSVVELGKHETVLDHGHAWSDDPKDSIDFPKPPMRATPRQVPHVRRCLVPTNRRFVDKLWPLNCIVNADYRRQPVFCEFL